ncbi:MAG TPA: hypothetical protein VHC95_09235 [Opitutales bacterium]|nr:hypothetical protein [Opitutales bacterium]
MQDQIKIVVVAMYQPGGGRPGELSKFREGLGLRPWKKAGLPEGVLWRNREGVAAMVAGVGPVNTAVNLMTLGLHAGVDWRKTWWLVCGIAGGNPQICPLGGVAVADWVVDGDLAYDLHTEDHPPQWSTGLLPLGATKPYGRVAPGLFSEPAQVFHLDKKLAGWAARRAQKTILHDSRELAQARKIYAAFAAGARPPAVLRGDVLSAARFWHGARHHRWAERWVKYWTKNRGRFAAATMEDSGTLGALRRLHELNLADWRRVLLLRSISNYTLPPPGRPAHRHLVEGPEPGLNFPSLEAALENVWRVGRDVVAALLQKPPR